jgi:hypothetical protein
MSCEHGEAVGTCSHVFLQQGTRRQACDRLEKNKRNAAICVWHQEKMTGATGHGQECHGLQLALRIVNTHSSPVNNRVWTYPPSSRLWASQSCRAGGMWTWLGAKCCSVQNDTNVGRMTPTKRACAPQRLHPRCTCHVSTAWQSAHMSMRFCVWGTRQHPPLPLAKQQRSS